MFLACITRYRQTLVLVTYFFRCNIHFNLKCKKLTKFFRLLKFIYFHLLLFGPLRAPQTHGPRCHSTDYTLMWGIWTVYQSLFCRNLCLDNRGLQFHNIVKPYHVKKSMIFKVLSMRYVPKVH